MPKYILKEMPDMQGDGKRKYIPNLMHSDCLIQRILSRKSTTIIMSILQVS